MGTTSLPLCITQARASWFNEHFFFSAIAITRARNISFLSKFSADNFGKTTCRELHHLVCDILNMNTLHNKFSSSRNSPGWLLKKNDVLHRVLNQKERLQKKLKSAFHNRRVKSWGKSLVISRSRKDHIPSENRLLFVPSHYTQQRTQTQVDCKVLWLSPTLCTGDHHSQSFQ